MRGKIALRYLMNNVFAVTPEALEAMIAIVNDGGEIEVMEPSPNTLKMVGNVAVIDVSGPMVKRGGMFVNVCGATSYEKIAAQIDEAVGRGAETILFRVDTPGGDVAGADQLGEKIRGLDIKTVTLYEDLGASAGVWIFSAVDKVYANETTHIGSIGVVMAARVKADDGERIVIVSSNAPNKVCDMSDEACVKRAKARIDEIEGIFFERLERNRGMTKDQIVEGFDHGGTVMAKLALEIGFLDGVTTYESLITNLTQGEQKVEEKIAALIAAKDGEGIVALLGKHGIKVQLVSEDPREKPTGKPEGKEATEDDGAANLAALAAFLQTVDNVSAVEKAQWLKANKPLDEAAAIVAEREKAAMEALDTTPGDDNEAAAKALIDYAKQHQIKG